MKWPKLQLKTHHYYGHASRPGRDQAPDTQGFSNQYLFLASSISRQCSSDSLPATAWMDKHLRDYGVSPRNLQEAWRRILNSGIHGRNSFSTNNPMKATFTTLCQPVYTSFQLMRESMDWKVSQGSVCSGDILYPSTCKGLEERHEPVQLPQFFLMQFWKPSVPGFKLCYQLLSSRLSQKITMCGSP